MIKIFEEYNNINLFNIGEFIVKHTTSQGPDAYLILNFDEQIMTYHFFYNNIQPIENFRVTKYSITEMVNYVEDKNCEIMSTIKYLERYPNAINLISDILSKKYNQSYIEYMKLIDVWENNKELDRYLTANKYNI